MSTSRHTTEQKLCQGFLSILSSQSIHVLVHVHIMIFDSTKSGPELYMEISGEYAMP